MRFGACIGADHPEFIPTALKAGYDYIEGGFSFLAECDDAVFETYKKALIDSGLKCEAANGLFKYDMALFGKGYNKSKLTDYLKAGMSRGAEIGLEIVVFGSGPARSYPEYMTFADGFYALSRVTGDVIAPIADEYGITIVIEPLRKAETKIINTVKEGVMLAAAARKHNVSGLADLFHMAVEGDTFDDIRQLKGSIRHSHLANPFPTPSGRPARSYPLSDDEYDYAGFFSALEYAGCPRCSVEAGTQDKEKELLLTGAFLQKYK